MAVSRTSCYTRGLTIKRGVMQDASFIIADPGHASADTPWEDSARTRCSRDGTWAKKASKSQLGYKLHILMDKDPQIIGRIETTTASLHDRKIDLSSEGVSLQGILRGETASVHGQDQALSDPQSSLLDQGE